MFSYDEIKQIPKLLLTMTSLNQPEFEQLLPYFNKSWDEYVLNNYIEREDREREYGGGRDDTTLLKIEDKLLFILYYVKAYPLQDILAYEFGMSQGCANIWIHILSKVLKDALDQDGHLPERNADRLEDVLKEEDENKYAVDGTERRIQRPKDEEEQEQYYSGKKKAHTVKNVLIGGVDTQRVDYLSPTYEGKRHDKKIVDIEGPTFPEGSLLYKDTGFQGYEPEGVITFQPEKKPKGKELTSEQKEKNRLISSIRIVIEHIISGVKRCRIVKDIFRNTREKFDDLVMEIACGLHNFRVHCRHPYSK